MTDTTPENDSNELAPVALDEDVGRLVRMAGSRPKMPATSVERMREELRPLWHANVESSSPRSPRRLMAVAAVLALAVAAALLVRNALDGGSQPFATVERLDGAVSSWRGERSGSGDRLAELSVLETGSLVATAATARAALRTTTGHSLRLDHGTRILIVAERELRLEQGAVYVDSGAAGRGNETLSVLTPFGRVEELGTQYELRLAADSLTVLVREGEVSVGARGAEERAVAGERLVVSGEEVERLPLASNDDAFDWTQRIAPAWRIDGSKLRPFLAWAARETGLTLEIAAGTGIDEVVLRGDVRGLTPREALEAVLPAVGLEFRIDGSALVVTRSGEIPPRS